MDFKTFYENDEQNLLERKDLEKAEKVYKTIRKIKGAVRNLTARSLIVFTDKKFGIVVDDILLVIDYVNGKTEGTYRYLDDEEQTYMTKNGINNVKHVISLRMLDEETVKNIMNSSNQIPKIKNLIMKFIEKRSTLNHEVTHMVDQEEHQYFNKGIVHSGLGDEKARREYVKSGIEINARFQELASTYVTYVKNRDKEKFGIFIKKGFQNFLKGFIDHLKYYNKPFYDFLEQDPRRLNKMKVRIYQFYEDIKNKYVKD